MVKKPESEQLSLFDFSGDAPAPNDTEETVEEVVEENIETIVEEPKAQPAPVVVEEDPKGSPLYQKYMAIQNEYPDYVVCMRVGDFYEVFGYGFNIFFNDFFNSFFRIIWGGSITWKVKER